MWETMPPLSRRELSRIEIVRSWAEAYEEEVWTNLLLTPDNVDRFLMSPDRSQAKERKFMISDLIPTSIKKPSAKTKPSPKQMEDSPLNKKGLKS